MKRLILLLSITLAFSMSIAADVGTVKNPQLQTFIVRQPTFETTVFCIPTEGPQILIPVGSRDFHIANNTVQVNIPLTPDAYSFINPGLCIHFSVNNSLNLYNSWISRSLASLTSPPSPNIKTTNEDYFILNSTTRHVFS